MSNCGKFRKAPWKIEGTMPESEAMRILRAAREQLTSQRADFAKGLAAHFDQDRTPQAAQAFEQIQRTIEAIDAAIKDEANRSAWMAT
jgi:hypothetical protein